MKNNNNDIDQLMEEWLEELEVEHAQSMARLRSLGGWLLVGFVVWLAFVAINW